MPIALRGDTSVASMALALVGRQGIDARQSKVIEAMYRNTALSQAVNAGFVDGTPTWGRAWGWRLV